jgi:uncharacterized protein (DUF1697 family)
LKAIKKNINEIIKQKLKEFYDYDIDMWTLKKQDIENIYNNNPFENKKDFYIQIFITNEEFGKILMEEFNKIPHIENEIGTMVNNIFYWNIKKKNAFETHFTKILSKNSLKHNFTIRTIGTIEKVLKRMEQ